MLPSRLHQGSNGFTMNALLRFLKTPIVTGFFLIAACVCILHTESSSFLSDMRKDRDDLVVSLRQAQTPEPQITAMSHAFDRITSNVDGITTSFFAFASVLVVGAFGAMYKGPARQDAQH